MTWSSAAAVTTCFSGRVATTPWWAVPASTTATGARTPTQRSGARQRGASHNDVARLRGPALGHRGADAHSPRLDSTGPAVSMAVDGPQRRFRAAGLERAVLARRPRARAQAKALRLPFDPLDEAPEDPGLWSEVPLELLVRFACVPVGRDGRRLVLAFRSEGATSALRPARRSTRGSGPLVRGPPGAAGPLRLRAGGAGRPAARARLRRPGRPPEGRRAGVPARAADRRGGGPR